ESRRQLCRRRRALAVDRPREAAKDLGQDDAGVAARPHQAPMRGELGDLADLRGIRLLHVLDRRLQGQQHVGAGVAVRNRKDVEPVHLFVVGGQPVQAAQQSPLEKLSVHACRLSAATNQLRSSRTPCTLTLTLTTGTLTERSTSNLTVSCRLCATSEIRMPYWTITYTSMASPSSTWTTSTPLSAFSRRKSSAKPSRRPRPAVPLMP